MEQIKWFERTFDFSATQNTFPSILERLSGTPIRMEEKLSFINPGIIATRMGDHWSIKEHIGHLADLEPLWQGRLEDIMNGLGELRPADLQNTKTHEAGHNEVPLEVLLHRFRETRTLTLKMLDEITEKLVFQSALHPRLKTPMRTIDLCLFVAEHDDHHLASITGLNRKLMLDQ